MKEYNLHPAVPITIIFAIIIGVSYLWHHEKNKVYNHDHKTSPIPGAGKAYNPSIKPRHTQSKSKPYYLTGSAPTNSGWDSSVYQVKDYLKLNMKDPDSLQYIEWSKVVKQGGK